MNEKTHRIMQRGPVTVQQLTDLLQWLIDEGKGGFDVRLYGEDETLAASFAIEYIAVSGKDNCVFIEGGDSALFEELRAKLR